MAVVGLHVFGNMLRVYAYDRYQLLMGVITCFHPL